jgi:hypothetical protein
MSISGTASADPAAPRAQANRQARRRRVGISIVTIKKPTGAPWAKTTSRSGEREKLIRTIGSGVFSRVDSYNYLRRTSGGLTWIYKFKEIVNMTAQKRRSLYVEADVMISEDAWKNGEHAG